VKFRKHQEAYGLLFPENGESGFEVVYVGNTFETEKSRESTGGHLIRVSTPNKLDLEITLVNGRTQKTKSLVVPFECPQLLITLETFHSELDASPSDRAIIVNRTDSKWMEQNLSQFLFEYHPYFVFSYKTECGEIHDGSVLAYAFHANPVSQFKVDLINARSPIALRELASEHDVTIVYFRVLLRKQENEIKRGK